MDFVGDYRAKQRLAEQLRARQKAMLGAEIDTGPLVTQASGAFPGQVQANPWGNLAKLGTAYFANQAGRKAETAEEEAQAARLEALQGIMGGGAGAQGAGGSPGQPGGMGGGAQVLTPERAMQLQELGVDSGIIKSLMPKQDAIGALAQAAGTRQGRAFLVTAGKMTQEQKEGIDADEAAGKLEEMKAKQDNYLFEQRNKTFAPTQGRGETEIEFAQRDPEGYAKYVAQKAKAKGGEGGGMYEKEFARNQAKQDVALIGGAPKLELGVKRVDELINADEKNPYEKGAKYRAMDMVSNAATGQKASDFDPDIQVQEQAIQQFHLDAMEQMRGFGQVTENEQKIIAATQFDRYDSPAARTKKLKVIKGALQSGMDKVKAAKERARTGKAVLDEGSGTMTSPGGVSYTVE